MKYILKYLLLVVPFVTFFGCSTEPEKQIEYYLLKADSLKHAESVLLNDTIKIKVYGLAGVDGCHSFSHFEGITEALSLDLKVWGKVVPSDACPAVLVHFAEEYKTVARARGIYHIKIYQPDGSVVKDSVKIL